MMKKTSKDITMTIARNEGVITLNLILVDIELAIELEKDLQLQLLQGKLHLAIQGSAPEPMNLN